MPLLLSEQDIRTVLSIDDLIAAMQEVLIRYSAGEVVQPLRTIVEVGLQRAVFGVMPASIPDPPALGAKLVTVFGSNHAVGLPSHQATIILLDAMTGELVAVMDGRYITEARTAAVSAVSVRLLARGDAATLALIGSGAQARSHLEAIGRVRPLGAVRVWSPHEGRRAAFVREMRTRTGAPIRDCESARDALDGADIVVLATASREPVVQSAWVADGAHICAVGACRPDESEMEPALVQRGRLFVDSRSGAMAEAGDILLAMEEGLFGEAHIAGELGALAAGTIAGRTSASEVTIFKSLGMAVEDVAAAHRAYVRAAERGLGRGFVL